MGNSASGDQDQHHCDGAGGGAGVAVVDWCRVLSVGDDGKRMGYDAAMELQTQIDELKAEVAKLKALLNGGNPRFGTITCKEWRVIDENDNDRITATTYADGTAGVDWLDKDGKGRIAATTYADGHANVLWMDKDGKARISAATEADGEARVSWLDKDGKERIIAATYADGEAGVAWFDKDGNTRIGAATAADGGAAIGWYDRDGNTRIGAATKSDGAVVLPTKDLKTRGGWGWLRGNA